MPQRSSGVVISTTISSGFTSRSSTLCTDCRKSDESIHLRRCHGACLSTGRSAKVLHRDSLIHRDGLALLRDKSIWPLLWLQPSLLSEAVVELHFTPTVSTLR